MICAFGALIKEPLLSAHEMLNVHPSLLPRWRGAAPVERAIEAGDEETGVSIMRPTAELDAGPVFLQRAERIRPDDDYGSLAPRLAELGGRLLVETLDTMPEPRPQPEEGVTYADKIEAPDRRLDPERTAVELERRVRALNPHIGTWLALPGGERLGVRRAALERRRGARPGRLSRGRRPAPVRHGRGRARAARGPAAGQDVRWTPHRGCAAMPRSYADGVEAAGRRWIWDRPARPAASRGCAPRNLAGRYRCVYCLRRFELRSECPNCGAHSTIARMSSTANVTCNACGGSMLRPI